MNESNSELPRAGLRVFMPENFSPDGDRGGVNPFYVGDPVCLTFLVMKIGEGVA